MSSPRQSLRSRRRETGFTLIELLVVITILGILAAIVIFAVNGIGDKGKAASVSADAATLRTAEEAYCAKFGRYAEVTGTDGKSLVENKLLTGPSTLNTVTLGIEGKCGPAGTAATSFQINDTTPASLVNPGIGIGANPQDGDSRPQDIAVNSNTNRIFTANSADDTVSVLDGSTDAVIQTIQLPADTSPTTLAVSESKQKLYVGDQDGTVTVIDTTDDDYNNPDPVTLPFPKTGGGVAVASLDVDPLSGDAYVGGGDVGNGSIMVVDGTSGAATDIPDPNGYAPGGNFAFDVAPGRDKVYARELGGLIVINGGTSHDVTHVTFPGDPAEDDASGTQMLAVNTAANRIYASGLKNPGGDSQIINWISKTYIVDGAADTVETTLTEAPGADPVYPAFASNPATGLVYELAVGTSSNISVLDGTTRGPQTPVDPPSTSGNQNHIMVINPTTNRLYLQQSPTSGSGVGGILEVNLATLLTQVISPGRRLGAIAVDTTTNKIYTLDKNNGQVVVLK